MRISTVAYRDHPPQDNTYVTKLDDLTDDINQVRAFINNLNASGGGDCPEAVCCGMHDCLKKLSWREDSVKIAILICDAPPHGLCGGDSFPNGCPLRNDPVEIAYNMATSGITLYCAGCEPSIQAYQPFYAALCLITGGRYVPLAKADNLVDLIIGGAREEVQMEKMMAQINEDLMKEAAKKGERINEDELTKRIQEIMSAKSNGILKSIDGSVCNCFSNFKDLDLDEKLSDFERVTLTEQVKEMSRLKNMKEMKDHMAKNTVFAPLGRVTPRKPEPTTKRRPVMPVKTAVKPIKKLPVKKAAPKLRRSKRIQEKMKKLAAMGKLVPAVATTVRPAKITAKRLRKTSDSSESSTGSEDVPVEEPVRIVTRAMGDEARRLAKRAMARSLL